ncbi:MAG: glycosyltransferase family 39 protein, partial [Candidatus Rokubacteria bacterium]|nr:glycosyltransferase family 39 protein [Candidatus Rokubacteria bacterium]
MNTIDGHGPSRLSTIDGDGPSRLTARSAAVAVAVLVAAPFVLLGLGATPFDDPGEGMHAEIARELGRDGGAFALTLGGVRYVDKPPLLYWLMAAAFRVAGPSEAAARAVPALAALVAVGATAWLGARLLGPRAGVLAGLALLASPGFFAFARYVRPETLFVAALALGFAWALVGARDGRRGPVVAGLAAFGAAGLAKDPLGALIPPLAIGRAFALGGRARPIARWLPVAGVVAGLALAIGWWALAERATPGFIWYTVVDNHVLNVLRRRRFPDEDVPLGAAAFLVIALAGAVPWVVAAARAIVGLVRARAWRDPAEAPWIALALWAVGVLGVTALSPFRLPHYGLPAYPALALLAARGWTHHGGRGLALAHAALFAALAVGGAAAWLGDGGGFMRDVVGATDVATQKAAAIGQAAPLPPWSAMRPLVGAAALATGAGAIVVGAAAAVRSTAWAAAAAALTMLAILPAVALGTARVAAHRAVRPLAGALARGAGAADVVAHEGPLENSGALEWYGGRRPVIVDGTRSVLG